MNSVSWSALLRLVYPAAELPEIAREAGAYVCEVILRRTPLYLRSVADEVI